MAFLYKGFAYAMKHSAVDLQRHHTRLSENLSRVMDVEAFLTRFYRLLVEVNYQFLITCKLVDSLVLFL